MEQHRSEVHNASSKAQVKRAGRKEREALERRFDIYESVLKSQDGRELLWMFLCDCGVFTSPLHQSGSLVYYNIGRGDIGRELLADLVENHSAAYLLMESEARARALKAQQDRDAAHTPRAKTADNQEDETDG